MDVRLVLGTGRDLRIRIEEQVLVVLLTQARDYLIVTADVPRISNRQSVVSLQGNQPEGGRFVDPGIRLEQRQGVDSDRTAGRNVLGQRAHGVEIQVGAAVWTLKGAKPGQGRRRRETRDGAPQHRDLRPYV